MNMAVTSPRINSVMIAGTKLLFVLPSTDRNLHLGQMMNIWKRPPMDTNRTMAVLAAHSAMLEPCHENLSTSTPLRSKCPWDTANHTVP